MTILMFEVSNGFGIVQDIMFYLSYYYGYAISV